MENEIARLIVNGEAVVGVEFGSTRIKSVMIGKSNKPIATGCYKWENSQIDDIWTYSIDEIWKGLQESYSNLIEDVKNRYNIVPKKVKAFGFSGMMHGYMVFDKYDKLLTPFRTWRNNITYEASKKLTNIFDYPIPQRWNIAHLYQAILNKEEHIFHINYLTTLAGYVHWILTGEKVIGIGEASGMFPIDLETKDFNEKFCNKFDLLKEDLNWKIRDIFPNVLLAGEKGGEITRKGALLIDPTGNLEAGSKVCPPEGDAGTGMVATNSVSMRTGNVSAGTSVFAMVVLEKELKKVHNEIDLVTTPDGKLVGMAHSNNCSSDYDSWIDLFGEAINLLGIDIPKNKLYDSLFEHALRGDSDCGGLLNYGYISGEHITGFTEGRPLFVRSPNSNFNLANFMRSNLITSLCALRTGLNILFDEEDVKLDDIRGHGGFFKAEKVGQRLMAAATGTPVSILKTAGEGGAWGIALLASYMVNDNSNISLEDFLATVFSNSMGDFCKPDSNDVEGFQKYFKLYHKGLSIEKAAIEVIHN